MLPSLNLIFAYNSTFETSPEEEISGFFLRGFTDFSLYKHSSVQQDAEPGKHMRADPRLSGGH